MPIIRQILKSFIFFLNILLALYSLLVYQLSYSVSVKHWFGGFLMLSMPFIFAANIVFIIIWSFRLSPRVFLSFGILLIGYPFLKRTFQWHDVNDDPKGLSVLSYNVMWCDASTYVHEHDTTNAVNLVKKLVDIDADIKCIQELYNWDDLRNFRTIKKIRQTHKYYTYMHSTPGNDKGQGSIGLAIFSKYPIIKKRELYWGINHNGLLSIDIVRKKDTLRIINVQLRSMGIRVNKVVEAEKQDDRAKAKEEARTIYHQLKSGFKERAIQTNELEKWIKESPHPVILAGDFNELPYGYAYGRVRKLLANSFENAGRGFGFTYHRSPGYLRIDNIFYDEKALKIKRFKTFDATPYSDHYPIWGLYEVN